jgi:hypothetical protein
LDGALRDVAFDWEDAEHPSPAEAGGEPVHQRRQIRFGRRGIPNYHHYVDVVADEAEEDPAHVQSCVIKWFLTAKEPALSEEWVKRLAAMI